MWVVNNIIKSGMSIPTTDEVLKLRLPVFKVLGSNMSVSHGNSSSSTNLGFTQVYSNLDPNYDFIDPSLPSESTLCRIDLVACTDKLTSYHNSLMIPLTSAVLPIYPSSTGTIPTRYLINLDGSSTTSDGTISWRKLRVGAVTTSTNGEFINNTQKDLYIGIIIEFDLIRHKPIQS